MSDDDIVTVLAARVGWELIPEHLREELIPSEHYMQMAALTTTQIVSFGASGPSVDAAELIRGVRTALDQGTSVGLVDKKSGETWICRKDLRAEEKVVLERGEVIVRYPYSFALHPNQAIRLSGLREIAKEVEFEPNVLQRWTYELSEGPLSNKLLDEFEAGVWHSPAHIERGLREVFSHRSIDISKLVPNDAVYYDRLIGILEKSSTIEEFINNELTKKLQNIAQSDDPAAFNRALLLNGHQNIASVIAQSFTDLSRRLRLPIPADLMSRVTMLEVLALGDDPDITAVVELSQMIRNVLEPESVDAALLEALFSLVEGRLARTGTLAERPPFWRRLASLAHAALIWRVMPPELRTDADFRKHLLRATRFEFAVANLLDLRAAPRWLPSYANADQFRAEVLGRVAIGVNKVAAAQPTRPELEAEVQALKDRLTGFFAVAAFMPGPCEGALEAPVELGEEARGKVESGLRTRPISMDALRTLFANSLVFRIDETLSKLAVDAVRELTTDVVTTRSNQAVAELLPQLAQFAAVTRNQNLFAEVKILCRLIRRLGTRKIGPLSEFDVVLLACAAWLGESDYNRELGSWFEELSLSDMSADEASSLLNRFGFLAYVKSRLWQYLAPAMAAAQIKALSPVPA